MNSKVILAALLVVVFRGSSAEKLESLELSENFPFETRGSRERRDVASFHGQLGSVTYTDITSPFNCKPFPCVDKVNKDWCPALCSANETAYKLIADSLISCYAGGICKEVNYFSGTNITVGAVNVSIGAGNYNGQCYLYGKTINMTLTNYTTSVTPKPPMAAYYLYTQMFYLFQGFTLYCKPADSAASKFQVALNITQKEMFYIFSLYQKGDTKASSVIANNDMKTDVSYASKLPTNNTDDITNGIVTVMQTFGIATWIQSNFYNMFYPMLAKLYSDICPKCS